MSETAAEATATEAEATEQATEAEEKASGGADLGDAGKKAIQAERDARKEAEKRASEAEKRVREFEDSQKTQAERDAESRAALERTAAVNAAKALRYEVAEKAGLPLSAAGRLQGDSEEALLKDAESLKALLGSTADANAKPVPKPDKSQGGTGGSPAPKNLSDAISAHYA